MYGACEPLKRMDGCTLNKDTWRRKSLTKGPEETEIEKSPFEGEKSAIVVGAAL